MLTRIAAKSFRLSCLCAAAAATLTLGFAGPARSAPSGDLRFGVFIDLRNWNPQTQPNLVYVGPVYEGLLQIKNDGQTPEAGLAESWELTATEAIFKLRQGVTFHDGTPFNADAVLANIASVQKAGNSWTDAIGAIKNSVKIDDHTVKFELKHPDPALPYTFTQPGLFMISPKALADESWKTVPTGTGPYVYDAAASVAGSKYVFRFYEKYYAPDTIGPASIEVSYLPDDAARFNALLSGQLDVAHGDPTQVQPAESAGFKMHIWTALRYHLILLDRKELFGDVRVRKALCMAMPREQISVATDEGLAKPATQWVDEGDPAYVADLKDYAYDIEGAKALMTEAGSPKISFPFPTYEARVDSAQLIQESFAKIGVNMELQVITTGEYFSTNLSGKYPLFNNVMTSEQGGMFRYYPFRFAKDGKANVFKADPPAELDRLYNEALTAPADKQPELLQKMTRIINDEALDCGFLDLPFTIYYDPKRVNTIATTKWGPSALRYKDIRMAE
jgi:peptide/nickel transport system substrate-binding protein